MVIKFIGNPFVDPAILDRRIEKFSACMSCNTPFVNKNGNNATLEDEEFNDEPITVVTCAVCGRKYHFRNFKIE